MMRLTVALCIDAIAGARPYEIVPCQALGQLGEALEALPAAGRPALLEHHDQPRRTRVEVADQLGAECADGRLLGIVEEVEVVDEARRLPHTEAQQRVDAAAGR